MSNDGIDRLLKAEEEALDIVKKARAARQARLFAADEAADKEIAQKRDEFEEKFQKEINAKSDISDEHTRKLKESTESESAAMNQRYNDNKQQIVGLMMHHVTTVDLTVSPAMKQALTKYVNQ